MPRTRREHKPRPSHRASATPKLPVIRRAKYRCLDAEELREYANEHFGDAFSALPPIENFTMLGQSFIEDGSVQLFIGWKSERKTSKPIWAIVRHPCAVHYYIGENEVDIYKVKGVELISPFKFVKMESLQFYPKLESLITAYTVLAGDWKFVDFGRKRVSLKALKMACEVYYSENYSEYESDTETLFVAEEWNVRKKKDSEGGVLLDDDGEKKSLIEKAAEERNIMRAEIASMSANMAKMKKDIGKMAKLARRTLLEDGSMEKEEKYERMKQFAELSKEAYSG